MVDGAQAVSAVFAHDMASATRSQPLAARVIARKNELEDALANCGPHDVLERQAIQTALASVYDLMTGDIFHPCAVVACGLSRWLERNRHLGRRR